MNDWTQRSLLFLALIAGIHASSFPASAPGQQAATKPIKPKVVCFGDSITKRGYGEILANILDVEAINAGVGGNSTAKALRRLSKDVLAHKPDVVVIFFGTNDLRADADHVYVPVLKYKANLETMIDQCQHQGARVVLCTLPPIEHAAFFTRHQRGPFDAAGGLSKLIQTYRDAARQVASEKKVTLVDLNTLLAQQPEWLSNDGVHPSKEGNTIIAKHIAKAVAPMVANPAPESTGAESTGAESTDLESTGADSPR
ncbi:Arylesterase precursor [Rubripirellula lacrimiformis]|uniref:Arylesterase n=1 Tax=Rubripirellula lacrimiformis TaxID=1930273 RepID=A0A517ND59_9BACT|nr:GDSL-type esterase/lipase family protein [Rubripirellula lacrimiformis]QDT05051.1 Arylesterase precursor [Rubripirellula lacrimiformis]